MSATPDEEHLNLLSIFHYVVGGIAGFIALFPCIHLVVGLLFIIAPDELAANGEGPPALIGWFFVVFSLLFILTGWTFAALVIATGRFLRQRKHHKFCLVMACVECAFMPFGTVLGVFTIIALMKEQVKMLFLSHDSATPVNTKPDH